MKYANRKPLTDLIGQVFTRLTAVEEVPTTPQQPRLLRCRCACGRNVVVNVQHLKRGMTRSCGCLMRDINRVLHRTHGGRRTPEYGPWCHAKDRCFNPNDDDFDEYGGRGITMCTEWRDDFAAFVAHIGPRPSGASLDRIDANGHYEPGNVRWANTITQANNKRSNHRLTYHGERLTLADWAARVDIQAKTLQNRISRGWSVEDALTIRPRIGSNGSLRRQQAAHDRQSPIR